MKPTIVISIVDGVLFPNRSSAHSRYTLHEKIAKEELSDLTQIHFLELEKIDVTKPVSEMTSYERIGAYFKYASDETKQDLIAELFDYETEVLTLTKPILEEVSLDARMRDLEEAHDKYIRTLATHRSEGREEGIEEGIEKGTSRTNALTKKLLEAGRLDDLTRALDDQAFQNQLFEEYGL